MQKLELTLRKVFRELYDWQVAFIFKCPEAMHQTPVDFFGHTAAGRAILIEAKEVNRESLPVGIKPGLLPHQVLALRQASDCGCHSIVVWQHGEMIMPIYWHHFVNLYAGRKSVPLVRARQHRVEDLLRWFRESLES